MTELALEAWDCGGMDAGKSWESCGLSRLANSLISVEFQAVPLALLADYSFREFR